MLSHRRTTRLRTSAVVAVTAGAALAVALLGPPPPATATPDSASATVSNAAVAVRTAAAKPKPGDGGLDVYVTEVDRRGLDTLLDLGLDRQDLDVTAVDGEPGRVRVEAILTGSQAAALRRRGVDARLEKVGGRTAAQRSTAAAAAGFEVFRKYSGPGGIKREFQLLAQDHPKISELVSIGTSLRGQDIVALKVTKNARTTRDGRKPAVLYLSAQHAREWITPEMTRRLATHVLDRYGKSDRITRLVDRRELWFVPVANPDGYDFTFRPGQRLWRKNLRDNNGDGKIAAGDGVDLNRNYATRWGYDDEGSSPSPASETYRGRSPGSEPESKALDRFVGRVGFEFFVNYHSAAELLLYGSGWQVATPTPDDVIYEAMVGDDAEPAVPGYDPDLSAELYTTNGDTDTHMTARYGTLGFTPEMTTCETVSDSVPDDEWEAEDCQSGFNFPDDEGLIEAEFRKNIPFALSVADSAADPDDPVSVVGRDTPSFVLDPFDTSYGSPQPVAVTAKRSLRQMELRYRVNGGPVRTGDVERWRGGERYGGENDDYYAEYRGVVRRIDPGDRVRAWFTAVDPDRRARAGRSGAIRSDAFGFRVASDSGARVLVIANEDYEGVNPTYDPPLSAPKYVDAHRQALRDAGYRSDVWDVDAQGVPHPLGVLGHYDAVLWYLGDNRITQDPEDEEITTELGELTDVGVAERQQYLTLAVRDYLNEGGKLVHAGETAQYQGQAGVSDIVGGLYYGLNGDPEAECVVGPGGFFDDCLILADDFRQYYLGAFSRIDGTGVSGLSGTGDPLTGFDATFGGPVVEGANPLDEAGVFSVTSDELPAEDFPQFASRGVADYVTAGEDPFAPVEGERYAAALHEDDSYMRLTKSIDLSGATAAELAFALSLNTESSYDNVIVEARTAGADDWTTLPSAASSELATTTDPPADCDQGFLLESHPFLGRYLGGADCTEGEWNALTSAVDGSTSGWRDVAFDLSAFAGRTVEVSISYVTDGGGGGVGVFVDDTRTTVDGVVDADGFEGAAADWTVGGPPEGSAPNAGDWVIGEKAVATTAATATDDTLLLGFGLEQLQSDDDRARLLRRALRDLLR